MTDNEPTGLFLMPHQFVDNDFVDNAFTAYILEVVQKTKSGLLCIAHRYNFEGDERGAAISEGHSTLQMLQHPTPEEWTGKRDVFIGPHVFQTLSAARSRLHELANEYWDMMQGHNDAEAA